MGNRQKRRLYVSLFFLVLMTVNTTVAVASDRSGTLIAMAAFLAGLWAQETVDVWRGLDPDTLLEKFRAYLELMDIERGR